MEWLSLVGRFVFDEVDLRSRGLRSRETEPCPFIHINLAGGRRRAEELLEDSEDGTYLGTFS